MKFINTKAHGVLDYLVSILLISSPWLLGFDHDAIEAYIPPILGAFTIAYSLFTNYEFGVAAWIPMKGHLAIDALSGIFLIASPWLFGFAAYVWKPHVVFGILELLVVLCSQATPSRAQQRYKREEKPSGTY